MSQNNGLDPNTPAYKIAHSKERWLRVKAGPGTGKSFAMQQRVARLLENGVPPEKILPVTFTRVAAEDLHRELIGMEVDGCDFLEGVTLHSLALKILMRNHVLSATGRIARPLNDFEIEPLICDLKDNQYGKKEINKLIKTYEAGEACLKQKSLSQKEKKIKDNLLDWLNFHEAMLIGEVIPQLHEYLHSNPAAKERKEFLHILVDEYQDLNLAEQGVIELLSDGASVCIVGDEHQSIYSFKHAHPMGIDEWLNNNKSADDYKLDECYRCPRQVVEMANSLISHNNILPSQHPLKPIHADDIGNVEIIQYKRKEEEIANIAERVSQMISGGVPAGDILVLTQSKFFGMPLYEALVNKGVPTKSYYGESELYYSEAQRAFALLKLFVNREDRVALRWLVGLNGNNWHAAGYRHIRKHCEDNNMSPWNTLTQLKDGRIKLSSRTDSIVNSFRDIVKEIDDLENLPDLASVIDQLFPGGQDETRDIRDLALKAHEKTENDDRIAFIRELSVAISQPEIPSEIKEVRIMSLHKSKGLSSPITIIAGCVQGLLPRKPDDDLSPAEKAEHLEEQRRLFYVGVTRAQVIENKEKSGILILTYCMEMLSREAYLAGIKPAYKGNGKSRLHASKFIGELGSAAPSPITG